jgi:DMSO/TMAO reductase YedYZ molybdopterin-dependent catalytic subunit
VKAQARAQLGFGAVTGIVSSAAGLAVSELASGYLHQRVSPVVAVAESIIRLTPGAVIEKVISIVGHNDKPLVIGATLFGLLIASAIVGIVALRSLGLAELLFAGMGVVLLLAVHARLTSSEATYIPAIVGVVVALVTLATLTPRALRAAGPRVTTAGPPPVLAGRVARTGAPAAPGAAETVEFAADDGSPPAGGTGSSAPDGHSRRDFVRFASVIAGSAVVVGVLGRVQAHGRAAIDAARSRLRLPVTRPTEPTGVEVGVKGVAPWVTSQNDFYRIDTALSIPEILPMDWSLRIHGMVDKELTLTYQGLIGRGLTEAWLTLCCVSNEVGGNLISNAWFSGVRIADVLADAGVQAGADAVLSTSQDQWTCGTPLAALTDGRNAMFAVAMNGQPLAPEHGFPVRMVVPGLYGYVSGTKWVVDLEVTRFDKFTAFWTDRGWSPQGPVKTESRIDVPSDGDHVSAGTVAIGGVAWAQHTGIAKVEVRVDQGPWVPAKLGTDPSIDSWRQWAYVWSAPKGQHRLQVRATDKSGYTQTGAVADVVPNGATGWHTIQVQVD